MNEKIVSIKNYIIVYQPGNEKFQIVESLPNQEDLTLIGDVSVSGHIVGIENDFDAAKKRLNAILGSKTFAKG